MEDTGLKLFEFVNNSFSNTIKSALEKQSKDKRKVNCRKYIEKNRQKTCRKSLKTVNKPKVAVSGKNTSRKLQQNRLQQKSFNDSQYLPPWPAFDNGYTILPGAGIHDPSLLLPAGAPLQGCDAITQSTLDLDQMLQSFLAPPATVPVSTIPVTTAPFETTVDYTIDCYSDHSRPLSPYDNQDLTSNISEKDLEDLMIDQLQGSPGSGYSSSASCVPSPHRICEPQIMPPMGYSVYEDISLFH